jgi:hypothetical protein
VSVWAASNACYCRIDSQQCLTSAKTSGCLLVIAGVLVYSWAKHLAASSDAGGHRPCKQVLGSGGVVSSRGLELQSSPGRPHDAHATATAGGRGTRDEEDLDYGEGDALLAAGHDFPR